MFEQQPPLAEKPSRRLLIAAWVMIPVLTLASQSIMKMLAIATGAHAFGLAWCFAALHSPWFYALIVAEIFSFFLWMHILSHLDVSRAQPLTSISYVLILAVSTLIFKENLTFYQLFGAILILSGVVLISTAPRNMSKNQIDPV